MDIFLYVFVEEKDLSVWNPIFVFCENNDICENETSILLVFISCGVEILWYTKAYF